MSRHLLWIVAALMLGLSALLSSTPAMAHGDPATMSDSAIDCPPVTAERASVGDAQASIASEGSDDEACPCCPAPGRGCCAATLALSPAVSGAPRPMSGAFRLGRDGAFAPATAFYLLDEPPASA